MDSFHKSLIKFLAFVDTYKSSEFTFRAHFYQNTNSLFCLIMDSTSVDIFEDNFSCSFFYDCHTKIIYLEDYGTIYSGRTSLTSKKELKFTLLVQEVIQILTRFKELEFKRFQTTTSITEGIDFLVNIGFEKKEQLNHYGNTKFIMELPKD